MLSGVSAQAKRTPCRLCLARRSVAGPSTITRQLSSTAPSLDLRYNPIPQPTYKPRSPDSFSDNYRLSNPNRRNGQSWGVSDRPPNFRRPYPQGGQGQQGQQGQPGSDSATPRRRSKPSLTAEMFVPPTDPSHLHILQMILQRLPDFVRSERFRGRIHDYGIDLRTSTVLIRDWKADVEGSLSAANNEDDAKIALSQTGWDAERFILSFNGGEGDSFAEALESAFTRRFLTFASVHPALGTSVKSHIKSLLDVTDMTRLPFRQENVGARSMKRHFHLHIGPTNSGKTYNALKALAQAESGAYAGPLRLLAHEVWERLNLGTVGGLDGVGKKCNLLTGEERRIVDPEAGLISCTVEMIPLGGPKGGYDVVVIDEIQMLGDTQRGGAWTAALLGVRAKEVHLCGDETTVELLKEIIPSLGDEMTIHRYERLTPLTVADESLNGDLSKVQAGDCVVTFSRRSIYDVKKHIESTAGKKCAVVYGALPPETRAEQAREFNDDESQCEILVASDAVGMGLNLKINRIIFESLEKFNGRAEVPLALTQVKQIAGRAGRFGMQRKDNDDDPLRPDDAAVPGGSVTTLHKTDLPILRQVLPMPLPPIKQAVLDVPFNVMSELAILLPPGTVFAKVLEHLKALAIYPQGTRPCSIEHRMPVSNMLEPFRGSLSLKEIDLFTYSPLSTRDPIAVQVFSAVIKAYAETGFVDVQKIFSATDLLRMLDKAEATLALLPPLPPIIGIGRRVLTPPIIVSSIPNLESMHKILVLYIWLSFRLEVAFPHRNEATQLKHRVEVVLEECLQRFPGLRNKKTYERTKQGDRAVADWRKQYVAPNGTIKTPGADRKGIKWVEEAVVQRLRNKQIWQSTGVVPYDRVLKEVDGLGIEPAQIAPPPALQYKVIAQRDDKQIEDVMDDEEELRVRRLMRQQRIEAKRDEEVALVTDDGEDEDVVERLVGDGDGAPALGQPGESAEAGAEGEEIRQEKPRTKLDDDVEKLYGGPSLPEYDPRRYQSKRIYRPY